MNGGLKVRAGLVSVVVALFALPAVASAATRHVTTTQDKGSGSLRQKIKNADPSDTIAIPKGRYKLTKGEIKLHFKLKIRGADASRTIVDGRGKSRVFEVTDGSGPVNISRLTITGGRANPGGGILNAGQLNLSRMTMRGNVAAGTNFNSGGAIANSDTLKLQRVTLRSNRTSSNAEGFGGAIAAGVSPLTKTGSVTVDRSRLTKNRAPRDGFGGAISAQPTGDTSDAVMKITRSRIDHNQAKTGENFSGTAGGIFFDPLVFSPVSFALILRGSTIDHNSAGKDGTRGFAGGIEAAPHAEVAGATVDVRIENSTIAYNRAFDAADSIGGGLWVDPVASGGGTATAKINNATIASNESGIGGGVYLSGEPTSIGNSIVASNKADTDSDCSGSLTEFGHNLESHQTCGFVALGDIQNTPPGLKSLHGNGGPTPTRALSKQSPARNAGDDVTCAKRDQRGFKRPQGSHCDIGAFEFRTTKHP